MIFYRVECKLKNAVTTDERRDSAFMESIRLVSEAFNEGIAQHGSVLICQVEGARLQMGVIQKTPEKLDIERMAADYLKRLEYGGNITSCTEVTQAEFSSMVTRAYRKDFITDDEEFCAKNDMPYVGFRRQKMEEYILSVCHTRETAARKADELLCAGSFLPEIERIFSPAGPDHFAGHPVHYLITADSDVAAASMRELLIGALFGANRLPGRRCCITQLDTQNHTREEDLETAYHTLSGGTSVICINAEAQEGEHANPLYETLSALPGIIKKHRRNVLTILECKRRDEQFTNSLLEELHGITVVHLDEKTVFRAEAKKYLRHRAASVGIKNCKALYGRLGEGEKGFIRSDLDRIFEKWYDRYLRTELYPQYGSMAAVQHEHVRQARGSAIDELNAMIGLAEPKRIISEAIDFHKAQKLFSDKGFIGGHPAMHMVFAGNPGTAKTSVARLFAQIMKDNGLLRVGKLIEVGRADLVGKYVGWTAQTVKNRFKAAKGSVLFIDEAYALVEDRGGLYGDEAINTIVQEMENARNDTVVIFAGYPEKMAEFIARNPGLKSRIAFDVHFPDYGVEELMRIFSSLLKGSGREADEVALEKVRRILERAAACPDFGNGRFVRTLLEKATLKQAARLMRMDAEAVSKKDAVTLLADDFDQPSLPIVEQYKIGF